MSELRDHLAELHPHVEPVPRKADAQIAAHAREHHRYYCTHHHGPNPGPGERPEGLETGGGVVMRQSHELGP